jgi:hypothetical protein
MKHDVKLYKLTYNTLTKKSKRGIIVYLPKEQQSFQAPRLYFP